MTATFKPLRAPFPWFGGKSRAAHLVWPRFGDVPNYVEPFAGSLAVLLGRPTSPRIETVNDLDCYLSNFWRAVQVNPEEVARYADWPLCGYEGEHAMPESWECVAWKATGGYASSAGNHANSKRERIWFSPHCVKQASMLFMQPSERAEVVL